MAHPTNDIDRLIARLADNCPLDAAAMTSLRAMPYTVRHIEAGQYLLREGDRPRHCSFLLTGVVYRHKLVGDGGRQIVGVHLPRELIDVQQMLLREADHNVQALTQASLMTIVIEEFASRALAHPTLAIAIAHAVMVEASILREWVANVGRRDARSRTAHLLCEIGLRSEIAGLGPREALRLPMTQEQIGDALGLTAVHVNRTLKTLEKDGVITRDKRAISIAHWNELQLVGDFRESYLHSPGRTLRYMREM